jgi:cytochrome P450 family 4
MSTCTKDFGSIFRVWLGVWPTFVMTDPVHLQTILGSSKHVDKSWIYTLLINFLGNGLITSSGKTLIF